MSAAGPMSQPAPRDAPAPADRDPDHVLQGLGRPGERETYGSFAGFRVGEYGLGSGQHLVPGVELGRLDVIGEEREAAVVAVGAEVTGFAVN